ncbi:MAG: CDP-alcohol phosphatidyltransferase family protein [Myxococcota bacterium]|nr:CDP-alcohol phosphatidyltransferase family protein [Myxococcota bacterium]
MLSSAARVYRETRKKHDQLFNVFVMRPVAAVFVAAVAHSRITPNQVTLLNLAVFVVGAAILVAFPSCGGGVAAVLVIELSYCLDCADGMLARFKGLASKAGHLFDFFTDEVKAVLLVAALAVRAWRSGGLGFDGREWNAGDARFLLAGIAGVAVVATAVSLTTFVRRPEISGQATTVEAHYERVETTSASKVKRGAYWVTTFLRFANHYPSHLWLWAILGHMEAYLWVWIALNAVYLARGWMGLVTRFGRS